MSTEPEVEPYYDRIAKELIEFLYNKEFLNSELSLETINEVLRPYFGFLFQSYCQQAARTERLVANMKKRHDK